MPSAVRSGTLERGWSTCGGEQPVPKSKRIENYKGVNLIGRVLMPVAWWNGGGTGATDLYLAQRFDWVEIVNEGPKLSVFA